VALSVVLLVGSGLLIRTITAMQHADVGLNPTGLASVTLRFPPTAFPQEQARRDALRTILARLLETPGISAAAAGFTAPPDYAVTLSGDMEIEGRAPSPADSFGAVLFNRGTQDLFRTAGLRVIAGRAYDFAAGRTEVVINESFAQRFWPNGALGHRVKIDSAWATVVGVVANTVVPGEKGPSQLQHYQPLESIPARIALIVRSSIPVPALEGALQAAVKDASPLAAVSNFKAAPARFADARAVHRFTLGLVGVFAATALLLAAIGLAAVIGYAVSQRKQEIGIRIALGASTTEIAGLVVRQGVVLAAVGVLLGTLAGLAATRLMQSMLYGVAPGDPITIGIVAMLLLAISLIACVLPARRAAQVDPLEMLRAE
jgi:predicted permease